MIVCLSLSSWAGYSLEEPVNFWPVGKHLVSILKTELGKTAGSLSTHYLICMGSLHHPVLSCYPDLRLHLEFSHPKILSCLTPLIHLQSVAEVVTEHVLNGGNPGDPGPVKGLCQSCSGSSLSLQCVARSCGLNCTGTFSTIQSQLPTELLSSICFRASKILALSSPLLSLWIKKKKKSPLVCVSFGWEPN